MALYIPERAPSSVSSSSTPSSPKAVNFAGVSGVSRPVSHAEQWACYYFELHAYECPSCRDPYARYKAGKRLCSEGNSYAIEVTSRLFRKDGEVYSRVREDGQKPRVEKPAQYDRSWSLLKAAEKSAKHRRPFLSAVKPKPSADEDTRERRDSLSPRTQPVQPVSARRPPVPAETYERRPGYTLQQLPAPTPSYNNYNTTLYTAVVPTPLGPAFPASNRGSLYETELARMVERDQQESQNAYKLHVPERVPKLSARGSVRRKSRTQPGFFV